MANREERFLMRQRGAGARQIDSFDFDFGLPTANEAPLQPIKSGRGRPRKTPQRESIPPASSRKTPKAKPTSKGGRASKGSGSNASKRLESSTNSETTKVNSVSRGTRSSSQPTRSDESGRATKKRRVNGVANGVAPSEIVLQTENVLPDIQESLQEDTAPEHSINVTNGVQDEEADAENLLAGKAPVTGKRKKRKSINMKPRKRANVGLGKPLQKPIEESDDVLDNNEIEPVLAELVAQETSVLEVASREPDSLQHVDETMPTVGDSRAQENKVLQEVDHNAPKGGSLPRRRKKRKSIVVATKSKKKPMSPLQARADDVESIGDGSSARSASQNGKSQKTTKKTRTRQKADISTTPIEEAEDGKGTSHPQRRGRKPGSGKTKSASGQIVERQGERAPIVSEESMQEDEDEMSSIPRRRGRPLGSRNAAPSGKKAGKVSARKKTSDRPKANQKTNSKDKAGSALIKAKDIGLSKRAAKVSEKKVRKDPKSTKRSVDAVPITVYPRPRQAQDDSEDEVGLDIAPYPKKCGVNAVDVLGQICNEIIDKNLNELEDEVEMTTQKQTKSELKKRHQIVKKFRDNLDETLVQMTEAVDHNEALTKRLRRAKKEKKIARADLLSSQKEVEEVAVELDVARMEHEEVSTANKKTADLNRLLEDIELAVQRGKAQQLRDMESDNVEEAKAMKRHEHVLQTTGA